MKEFRIIYAQIDGMSHDIRPDVLREIGARLVAFAGGYTRADGFGAWESNSGRVISEPVHIFDVATIEPDSMVESFARNIADYVKSSMAQESIYFRNTNGSVAII